MLHLLKLKYTIEITSINIGTRVRPPLKFTRELVCSINNDLEEVEEFTSLNNYLINYIFADYYFVFAFIAFVRFHNDC